MRLVLIIDDDRLVRDSLRRLLERLGYRVTEATDGQEALRRDEADPADVVLTDIYMPGMEGVETIRELRKRRPDRKVIAMSGGGAGLESDDSLRMAKLVGAHAALAKPFDRRTLQTALENALGDT